MSVPNKRLNAARALLGAVAALGVAAALLVWGGAHATDGATSTSNAANEQTDQGVPVYTVAAQSANASYMATGLLEPINKAVLAAQVGGRITQLKVNVGDAVKAGQVLATIDARVTQAGVAQASAQQEQAAANYRRVKALREQGFLSAAAVDAAKAQLSVALAAQSQASTANGLTRITAPFAGVVQATHQTTGDVAMPGVPVITMYAPNTLRVAVQLPLSQHAKLPAGVVPKAYSANGSLLQVAGATHASAADPSSQTVLWRLNLVAGSTTMLPGQTVSVGFERAASKALQVPATALVQRGEMTAVYVATPGGANSFVLRAVRTAAHAVGRDTDNSHMVSVLAGLRAGEQVATQPMRAAQGAPIGQTVSQ